MKVVLTVNEERVLGWRFREAKTLKEVAIELGVSQERAGQIERKAIRKLFGAYRQERAIDKRRIIGHLE